ncbi:hypothetical protein ScPMuIL_006932 [Solemya velum]
METINKWYHREVFSIRTGKGLLWTVLTIPPVTVTYVFAAKLSLLYSLSWLTSSLAILFSFYFLCLIITLMVINAALYIYGSPTFTVIPHFPETRLASVLHVLKMPRGLQLVIYSLGGTTIAWFCSTVAGEHYNTLSKPCLENSDRYCVNEYHLFLLLYGMYTGCLYRVFYYLQQDNYIQFPVLQQSKFFQIRCSLVSMLLKSGSQIIWQTKFFYPTFYFLGHIPRNWIAYNFGFYPRGEQTLLSLWGLLDLSLLWQSLMLGMFIHFTLSYAVKVFKVFNIEHFEFPLESAFDEYNNKCLSDALNCKAHPLVQHLGFLDLCILSKTSVKRRKLIFSLSQPGGHPHNWSQICQACLSELDALNQQVEEANWKAFSSGPVRIPSSDKPIFSTPVPGEISNLTFRGAPPITPISDSKSISTQKPEVSTEQWQDKISTFLKKKSIFSYFLSELPDAKSRKLFSSAQVQICAAEALSTLVAASYTEDAFGVVQKSLNDIITSILTLEENVEKNDKLVATVGRKFQREQGGNASDLKYSLQTTLKSSIYRIVNKFGKHIMELKLSSDCQRKLKLFMEYKR